jgi:hypothetical protein
MTTRTRFETDEAFSAAQELGLDFTKEPFDLEELRRGMDVELEHGRRDPATDVTEDDPVMTAKMRLPTSARCPTTTSVSRRWRRPPTPRGSAPAGDASGRALACGRELVPGLEAAPFRRDPRVRRRARGVGGRDAAAGA